MYTLQEANSEKHYINTKLVYVPNELHQSTTTFKATGPSR